MLCGVCLLCLCCLLDVPIFQALVQHVCAAPVRLAAGQSHTSRVRVLYLTGHHSTSATKHTNQHNSLEHKQYTVTQQHATALKAHKSAQHTTQQHAQHTPSTQTHKQTNSSREAREVQRTMENAQQAASHMSLSHSPARLLSSPSCALFFVVCFVCVLCVAAVLLVCRSVTADLSVLPALYNVDLSNNALTSFPSCLAIPGALANINSLSLQ